MADDGLPTDRLRQFLHGLTPGARETLVADLERRLARGENVPDASFILQELRGSARTSGQKLPRIGNPSRLFFVPIEPFLVDDVPERKHRGRISRSCLEPLWRWISRDLMPDEAKTYSDQVNVLLAANERDAAEQVARAFQHLTEQRMGQVLAGASGDDKARKRLAAQVSTPQALADVREIHAILRMRDALAVIAAHLPPAISNLAGEQLDNAKALLDSPIARHRDVFLYALLAVMNRLGAPWHLIRLAIRAAESDVADRVAKTPFAVAVDVVLTDIERMIETLRSTLRARRSAQAATLLRDIHDCARALRTEIELSSSPWGRQLAAACADVAHVIKGEIETIPGRVRQLLRVRAAKEIAPGATLDPIDVAETEAALEFLGACRLYAGELAASEATRRVQFNLQNYFDSGTQVLLDRLRAAPAAERAFRQSQLDATVRFCAKLYGSEYASLLAKAGDIAARGEQKLVHA